MRTASAPLQKPLREVMDTLLCILRAHVEKNWQCLSVALMAVKNVQSASNLICVVGIQQHKIKLFTPRTAIINVRSIEECASTPGMADYCKKLTHKL